jgi:NAD(P)H-dependent FMN reductase
MSEEKLSIPVVLGTNREGRKSEYAAKFIMKKIKERDDMESKLFDVRDFEMPKDAYGQSLKDSFPEWREAVINADGLVLVVPEYNHGYPGSFKSVMDLLLSEYIHKAVGLAGVSAGPWGGTRVIEVLINMVRELGLAVTFSDINFSRVGSIFDDQGNLVDETFNKRAEGFLNELAWMSKTLRWGRENVPSKFHAHK